MHMMSVMEYAVDVDKTVEEVLKLCKKLDIKATNEEDMLSEDDIIMLDNELPIDEEQDEEIEEDSYEDEVVDDDELEKDLRIEIVHDEATQKMKKKPVSNKKDNKDYLKAKKKLYKHKEKLQTNDEKDETVVLYKEGMTVKELADALGEAPATLIKKLFDLGALTNLNQSIDFGTAELLVVDYNKELVKEETRDISNFEEYEIIDKEEDLIARPPVVTIMGHVDHGKTSLLDAIRETSVVSGEAGGITQHIGAYQVKANDRLITFIDTPGHAAFTEMRARGASVTDIVIIIVSAEDGVKPQTIEAIDHAKAAKVPIIVAINKMDLPSANPERVLTELSEAGLTPEEWGGDTLVNKISAKTKMGIPELLDNILLVADMENLRANPNRYASGSVIEARLDKNIGTVATILIQNGTLRLGDPVVVGTNYGKVRTLKNDRGENITTAAPSTPVEITGLTDLPVAGDRFMAFETEKEARKVSEERKMRFSESNTNRSGMTLEDLFSKVKEGAKTISVVLKTDVKGSEEAIKQSLSKIDSHDVKVDVIRSGVGTITESDVILANASDAIIIGFNVRPNSKTVDLAKEYGVDIRLHNVIYKIIEELEDAILGMLDPEYEEKILGEAEVRQLFKFSKVGTIAGCFVSDGVIKNNDKARVIRDGIVIYDGQIGSIQRGKEKANEVKKGIECGITIENFNDIKEGDIIEAYTMEEVKIK
ncbi:MAG: translation initiation factor IF-2 [Bacilli bacterium]|nr:translation initiation factor IF-2 [Bacilli bacterium]